MMKVIDVRCEYESNPIAMANEKPSFGWKIESDIANFKQIGYWILLLLLTTHSLLCMLVRNLNQERVILSV